MGLSCIHVTQELFPNQNFSGQTGRGYCFKGIFFPFPTTHILCGITSERLIQSQKVLAEKTCYHRLDHRQEANKVRSSLNWRTNDKCCPASKLNCIRQFLLDVIRNDGGIWTLHAVQKDVQKRPKKWLNQTNFMFQLYLLIFTFLQWFSEHSSLTIQHNEIIQIKPL